MKKFNVWHWISRHWAEYNAVTHLNICPGGVVSFIENDRLVYLSGHWVATEIK